MNPEEQQAYAELICFAYSDEELDALEQVSEHAMFNMRVDQVTTYLRMICDHITGHTDKWITAAALEIVLNDYEHGDTP